MTQRTNMLVSPVWRHEPPVSRLLVQRPPASPRSLHRSRLAWPRLVRRSCAPAAGVCKTLVTVIGHFSAANVRPALLDHHHRAVIEIADALARLVARLHDANDHRLAGQGHGLEGVGHLVEVDDVDALKLGDLVEVEVVGDDAAADRA